MGSAKKIFNGIEEWTLTLILLGLAFLTFVQVFCRYLFHFSFSWSEELVRCLGVFITFLGASLGVKYGLHFSMDLLYEKVGNDRLRQGLQVAVNFLSGILFLVVAWYGWEHTWKLHRFGVHMAALALPKYWTYLPIPFFSVVMAIRFFTLSVTYGRRLILNEPYRVIKDSFR